MHTSCVHYHGNASKNIVSMPVSVMFTELLHFVLFIPVVSLVTLPVMCFICIYVMNYLGDVLRVML